jgi:hypothetical protein
MYKVLPTSCLMLSLWVASADAVNPDGPKGVLTLEPWYAGAISRNDPHPGHRNASAGFNLVIPTGDVFTLSWGLRYEKYSIGDVAPAEQTSFYVSARFHIPTSRAALQALRSAPR